MSFIVAFISLISSYNSNVDYQFTRSYDVRAVDYIFISAAFDDIEANSYALAYLRYYTLSVGEGENDYMVGITAGQIEVYDCDDLRGRLHHVFYDFENKDPSELTVVHIGYFDQVPWFEENCAFEQD